MFVLGLLAALLVVAAACNRQPEGEPSPVPATPTSAEVTAEPEVTPADTPTLAPSDTPTSPPITDADVEAALATVRDFLGKLSTGAYRDAYGSQLTTAGQERLSQLILGRLALSNPHISFFELLGAEPQGDRISVEVVWRETFDGQGDVGDQRAKVMLARQDDAFLVDDIELGDFEPAATPIPPSLPRADVLSEAPTVGEAMSFRASGFQGGETILAWLELPDGAALDPVFGVSDADGTFETTYDGPVTAGLEAGNWIWWVQALRDSSRNAGITFAVAEGAVATATPTEPPTATPRPVVVQPTQPPAAATVAPTVPPTDTPAPSTAYGAPVLLWPELETTRDYKSALIVEFQPVAEQLAPDEFYQLVLTATRQGTIYNSGTFEGKGGACDGQYEVPCRQLIGDQQFMDLFYPDGVQGRGEWFVQVVRETAPGQFTPVSPPSDVRVVLLNPRPG
ncbi:MAG: hypothetical protein R2844_17720 [Caldilineales bacterium]